MSPAQFGFRWFLKLGVTIALSVGVSGLLAGGVVLGFGDWLLQASLTDLRKSLDTTNTQVSELQKSAGTFSGDLGALRDVPAHLRDIKEVILREVSGARADLGKDLGAIRADLTTIRNEFSGMRETMKAVDVKMDMVERRFTETREDLRSTRDDIRQVLLRTPERRSDTTLDAGFSYFISYVPEVSRKNWETYLTKAQASGVKVRLYPFPHDGTVIAKVNDEKDYGEMVRLGFKPVGDIQPAGFYLTLP